MILKDVKFSLIRAKYHSKYFVITEKWSNFALAFEESLIPAEAGGVKRKKFEKVLAVTEKGFNFAKLSALEKAYENIEIFAIDKR